MKALVSVYGVYDLRAMWTSYQVRAPRNNSIEKFLGAPPMDNPQLYSDASAMGYATVANKFDPAFSWSPAPRTIWSTTKNTRFPSS